MNEIETTKSKGRGGGWVGIGDLKTADHDLQSLSVVITLKHNTGLELHKGQSYCCPGVVALMILQWKCPLQNETGLAFSQVEIPGLATISMCYVLQHVQMHLMPKLQNL